MSKKDEKILTLGYSIEALENELEHLEEVIEDTKAKLWQVICDNDRLTMTYEPYRPPGDKHEGLDFYELIEENDNLTNNVLAKIAVIKELEEEKNEDKKRITSLEYRNTNLANELREVRKAVVEMKPAAKQPRIKNDRWWSLNIELWPGAWGLNYHRYDWKKAQRNGHPALSREGQMQIGPFGLSWGREPKRG